MTFKSLIIPSVAALLLMGCGQEDIPYKPKPAYSGKKPTLPQVPTLPNKAKTEGGAYTIWGAMHDLRSVVHAGDFRGKQVSIVGWVVKTNYEKACAGELTAAAGEEHCVPSCAVHKTGKQDPEGCKAPVPTFWIADDKGEKDLKKKAIPVMGWASNFAQIFDHVTEIDRDDEAQYEDVYFAHKLPNPMPAVGGKVRVTGTYGVTYTKSAGGVASNPRTGIMTWSKQEWTDVPPLRGFLPGMKIRKKENKAPGKK